MASSQLEDVFAVLGPDLQVTPVQVTPTVYQELDERFDGFHGYVLISAHTHHSDWPTWERHPAGDEVVVLMSGRARFHLKTDGGIAEVALTEPGRYVVVPRNTWHTAKIAEPTRMLFVTPGEGTENREDV
jgi:mannose-6-phosphate isomerase-like protein (cupin superfamily)